MYLDSVYTLRPDDPQAVYVEPDGVSVFGDGVHDDTQAIQDAICRVKNTHNFGIVFLREGTYLISKTLFIPVWNLAESLKAGHFQGKSSPK